MPLTNYTELQENIAGFANRDDLDAVIPTFIALAEASISDDVRHWNMETREVANATEQYLTKPQNWMETIRLNVTGNGTSPLNLVSRDQMADMRSVADDEVGEPRYYCHAGNTFELYPTPNASTELELLYYSKVPALTDAEPTNWLLSYAPDVYLYGALVHLATYLHDDAKLMSWSQLYVAAVDRLNLKSEAAKYSGSGLKLKIRGFK